MAIQLFTVFYELICDETLFICCLHFYIAEMYVWTPSTLGEEENLIFNELHNKSVNHAPVLINEIFMNPICSPGNVIFTLL